jgi:preprotein translocase subunit Sec63
MSGTVQLAIIAMCCLIGYFAVSWSVDAWRRSKAESPKQGAIPSDETGWARYVLGVDAEADSATITSRYRELQIQYSPDKAQTLGPDIQRFAKQRSAQIRRAWEILVSNGNEPGATWRP